MCLPIALFPTALSKIAPSLIDNKEPIPIFKPLSHQNKLRHEKPWHAIELCAHCWEQTTQGASKMSGTGQSSRIKTKEPGKRTE